jgi:hypothetical protein
VSGAVGARPGRRTEALGATPKKWPREQAKGTCSRGRAWIVPNRRRLARRLPEEKAQLAVSACQNPEQFAGDS